MIDYKALAKHSRPGPRYTSYPTALEFSEDFAYEAYLGFLRGESQEVGRDLSLYFHLPFCRSACYFCGCNVIYTSKEESKERYLDYLFAELDLLAGVLDTGRRVVQLHFGGGTPTFFSAAQLERLILKIRSIFGHFAPDAELGCEIDPRFFSQDQAEVLSSNGFNRISFGVQDFDERVQREIHRIQSFELVRAAVECVRQRGIKSINMDLIYGLPYQSLDSFAATLKKATQLEPDRLAIFNYAHVPWLKKNMRKLDETTLPPPEVKLQILEFCEVFLRERGYEMIGMDHFAKPEDELFKALKNSTLHRNFQGYTTKKDADLIGIGLTSIGEGQRHYAQNFKDMKAYEAAIEAGRLPLARGVILTPDDELRKAVIMSLMANFSLDIRAIERDFGIVFREYFAAELGRLGELGELVSVNDERIEASPTGALLIRNVALCFDAYLDKIAPGKRVFSKTL